MKKEINFVCQACTFQASKWYGKCPECNSWNSFEQYENNVKKSVEKKQLAPRSKKISEINILSSKTMSTGFKEMDSVLGGGFQKGSVNLLSGEPGVGKSTLLLMVAKNIGKNNELKILIVSGEETEEQIAQRARRLKIDSENIYYLSETSLEKIKYEVENICPDVLVVDSLHTTTTENYSAGNVNQLKEVCAEIIEVSKRRQMVTILIGQITKEGVVAGPKTIEHLVDVVLSFENTNTANIKMLKSTKNRFGPSFEIGMLKMEEAEVKDCDDLIDEMELADESTGRSVGVELIGSRFISFEIQTLMLDNKNGMGKRTAFGIDHNRLLILIAVLEQSTGVNLSFKDIFVNVSGRLKSTSRESDLAIMASMMSALKKARNEKGKIYYGEVGLSGKIQIQNENKLKTFISKINVDKIVMAEKIAQEIKEKNKTELIGINNINELNNFY